jgi:hypothetical protein
MISRMATTAALLIALLPGCNRTPSEEQRRHEEFTRFTLTEEQKGDRQKLVQSVVDAIDNRSIQGSSAADYADLFRLADGKIVRPNEVVYQFTGVHAAVKPYGEGHLSFSLVLTPDATCVRDGHLLIPEW